MGRLELYCERCVATEKVLMMWERSDNNFRLQAIQNPEMEASHA